MLRIFFLAALLAFGTPALAHEGCVTAEDVASQAAEQGFPQAVQDLFTSKAEVEAWKTLVADELPPEVLKKTHMLTGIVDLKSNTMLAVLMDKKGCVVAHAHDPVSGRFAVLSARFDTPEAWHAAYALVRQLVERSKI